MSFFVVMTLFLLRSSNCDTCFGMDIAFPSTSHIHFDAHNLLPLELTWVKIVWSYKVIKPEPASHGPGLAYFSHYIHFIKFFSCFIMHRNHGNLSLHASRNFLLGFSLDILEELSWVKLSKLVSNNSISSYKSLFRFISWEREREK